MLVYFYDKTFEGLLTAIFFSYKHKEFPDQLMQEGDIAPLFTERTYTVVTSTEKAGRVWKALEKKISKRACRMLMHAWLSEIEGSDEIIFRYIHKAINSYTRMETNFGDKDVLEIVQIAKKVTRERHHLEQFVRFQKASDSIFFAPISPAHNALPLVINHFKDRFADQQWVIYDTKRKYGFYYDLKSVQEITFSEDPQWINGKLEDHQMAEDEKRFQKLWKGYFQALTIKERINLKLQRQQMPKCFWKYLTEKQY
ncbi:DNA metabolism protein [Apibacter muscae]|uniref:TIGR03915 family putative DNA repair protein n=1 Tax=Apibacter muscae TaxID=2509004 RepID=UPI0011ADA168|nr:TIGR03915 family putative DNA repair protein [Apibacter muscae]TWP30164.1 DNA metabolism protein [Apibacter muscae]